MLQMVRDLVDHKGYANAALLTAVRHHPVAVSDGDLSALLHHVLLANRFWLLSIAGMPFVLDEESRQAASFDALVRRYARTQAQESAWVATATSADLERTLVDPRIPSGECSVAQAFIQVCLHSHGHRAQAATRLRALGGTPPATDFIVWVGGRHGAAWPVDPDAAPHS
jgi:uncharacterized damage-inducible protein DinB